ncbi:MAG: DUF1552 domain-containing protein [Verrucomicrobia bacterium]|nr:MAG: DUF1552 domain-containing protein [Verrucomicrobiota bacterium]TAE89176.1 MAG: DUF1552 domain-containing protein [Verrucomicrobiota bacterium]TAF27948.1 MAG: DUF1552 domain-containing protein [Verrucomicrobiota bacterium]TAF42797.1 MAG: DUF1552 domain-containing protein [Verrucomicrobiota bacterium]
MANLQTQNWLMPRRSFLKGAGATLALPFLDAMRPLMAAGNSTLSPIRIALLYMPNGVRQDRWTPDGDGSRFKLSPILSPLEKHRKDLLVLTGLQNKASFTGDGHYVKTGGWLTGTTITKTTGSDIAAGGISMDQIAARQIGQRTKLPSLELGTEPVATGIDTNVNYTRLYASHISWKTSTVPLPCEINPRVAFDRLFRTRSQGSEKQAADDKSVLDLVRTDAKRLQSKLGQSDRHKLEQYLESIREVERRIEAEAAVLGAGENLPPELLKQMDALDQWISRSMGKASREEELNSLPRFDHSEHCRIMTELMVLAFWSDSTRVASFMFGNDVTGRNFSFLEGVNGGHHEISHHSNDGSKLDQYERINRWHIEQYGTMLDRMKEIQEGDGTLLDHSMVAFGSPIRDGNSHDPTNVPIVVAGGSKAGLKTGKHMVYDPGTPLCGLWISMLEAAGVKARELGDASDGLRGIG